jgi:hypothetical protein
VRSLALAPRHNDPPKTSKLDVSLPMKTRPRSGDAFFATPWSVAAWGRAMGCVSRDETAGTGAPRGGVSFPMTRSLPLAKEGAAPGLAAHPGSNGAHPGSNGRKTAEAPSSQRLRRSFASSAPLRFFWVQEDATDEAPSRGMGGVSLPMKALALSPEPLLRAASLRFTTTRLGRLPLGPGRLPLGPGRLPLGPGPLTIGRVSLEQGGVSLPMKAVRLSSQSLRNGSFRRNRFVRPENRSLGPGKGERS